MGGPFPKIVKPATEAEKATQTTLDTWPIDVDLVKGWKIPPFQRELRENPKVLDLAQQMAREALASKDCEVIFPGVVCIGKLGGEVYLVDGQHRRHAFIRASEIIEAQNKSRKLVGYVDVRIVHFTSMPEMADEYVKLNSQLVKMKPDDIIRGLESSCSGVALLRRRCSFIGYDNIRRGDKNPVLSMSTALRVWTGSASDTPKTTGASAAQLAAELTDDSAKEASSFFTHAFTAWGKDQAYHRLWGTLNLIVCAWLYRGMVMAPYSPKIKVITADLFTRCLMSLSADADYAPWLLGRNLNSRDLSPAYSRVKHIFGNRLEAETGKRPLLPAPDWATKQSGR